MIQRKCECCGEPLQKVDKYWKCSYCGSTFDTVDEAESLRQLIEEHKEAALANRRRVLWDETHKANPSKQAIVSAAESVREIYAEDPLACFYIFVHKNDPTELNAFLSETKIHESVAKEVARFMLISFDAANILPLKSFVEHNFKGDQYTNLITQIEKEADNLEEGLYMTSLPRKVFLAYSSKDMGQVNEMTQFLEENDFSVFCALRNLRHGKGAAENYESAIKDAMAHCEVFLFLSSANSRTLQCDALSMEIPYLLDYLPEMQRIHYRLDDEPTKTAASILLKQFDDGREWCRSKEDLVARILSFNRKKPSIKEDRIIEEKDTSKASFVLTKDDPDVVYEGGTLIEYRGKEKDVIVGPEFDTIARGAFKNAGNLLSLSTGEGVETLEPFALDQATVLKSLHIGPALNEIGSGAFARVPSLEKITIDEENCYFELYGGALMGRDNVFYRYPPAKEGTFYQVPRHTQKIDVGAFSGSTNLEKVEIPHGISSIGNGAFSKCGNLSFIHIPESVESMGKNVFAGCPNLVVRAQVKSMPKGWDISFSGGTLVTYGIER